MAEDNKTPESDKVQKEPQQAHPHHKDKGTIVKTAFGETLPGGIADIADGDDERRD